MRSLMRTNVKTTVVAAVLVVGLSVCAAAAQNAPASKPKPEFPPLAEVLKGYEKVVSTADGAASLYTIWTRAKDGEMLAALPSNYQSARFFIALTVASGETYAGLQAGDPTRY